MDPNVASVLWDSAARVGEKPALIECGQPTKYATMCRRTAAVADVLVGKGLNPADRVGILLERGVDAAAATFGVMAAGGVAVAVNETLRPRQIEHVLAQSGARFLVTVGSMLARLPRALSSAVTTLDVSDIPATGTAQPIARVGADVAALLYTSGSTGLPKGVAVTHANLWAGISAVVSYLEIQPEDRIASLLPLSFGYGLSQLLCAFGTGATLVVERSPIANQIASTLRSEEVTVLSCVPPLWLQLLCAPEFELRAMPSLRVMTNAGGKLPVTAVRRLRLVQPQAKLYLMYGFTEAFRATYLDPAEVDRRPDSIGKPIPGAEIYVLREDGTPCGPGEEGELVQRGPTVAAGYWNDPEATAARFRPNPLRPLGTPDSERVVYSGDIVRIDADGFLYFVGRRDRLIKSLGYRASPDEVLDVLHASGEIVEAVVDTQPDEQRGVLVIAYVVLTETGSADRLLKYCRTELPRYLQPARIEVRAALPRLSSGKYDVAGLRTPSGEASVDGLA